MNWDLVLFIVRFATLIGFVYAMGRFHGHWIGWRKGYDVGIGFYIRANELRDALAKEKYDEAMNAFRKVLEDK